MQHQKLPLIENTKDKKKGDCDISSLDHLVESEEKQQ
jgi:hypothetical protein